MKDFPEPVGRLNQISSQCWEWKDKFCNVRERNEKFQVGDPFLNTFLTRKLLMFFVAFLWGERKLWEDNGTRQTTKFKINVQQVTEMLRTYIELQWKQSMQIFQVFETYMPWLLKKNRQNQFFWATKNEHPKQTIFSLRELCFRSLLFRVFP